MNFRFPIAPPSTAVANPFTVAFDYVPVSPQVPLTAQQEADLYTTRITVSAAAAAAGADRIAHVFPRANVRFLLTDSGGMTAQALAQKYCDDADVAPRPVHGAWIALALPADVRGIRRATSNELFPTAVIYHDVVIDRSVVRQSIIPLLAREKITRLDADGDSEDVTAIGEKLALWLAGEARVSFPDVNNLSAPFVGTNFEFPRIPSVGGVVTLSLTALLMDGTGVEMGTLNNIVTDLREVLSASRRMRSARFLIHIPVSYIYLVLPPSELATSHVGHPLAATWPASPSQWSAMLFSFSGDVRGSIASLRPAPQYETFSCQMNSDPEFPLPRTGLFFFRSLLSTNQVRVFQQAGHAPQQIHLFTSQGAPMSGTMLSIPETQGVQGIYRLIIGTPSAFASAPDHFFGVPRSRDRLQDFINEVTARHMSHLTTAGAFARTMGYVAEMVVNWLATHPASHAAGLRQVTVPPSASFRFVLAAAFELLVEDGFKVTGGGIVGAQEEVAGILNSCGLSFTGIIRPEWMNTHEDDGPGAGWRVFSASSWDNTGRKDHFLVNAVVRLDSTRAAYEVQLGGWNLFEDIDNDKEYNDQGRHFTVWGDRANFQPELVEQWILDHLVERQFVT